MAKLSIKKEPFLALLLFLVICLSYSIDSSVSSSFNKKMELSNNYKDIEFSFIETNGIKMRIAQKGEGPLVLLVHGWPESWYSWRHQILSLSEQGYRVVAPDMRGYGETDSPDDSNEYNIKKLTADMVGILDALGAETATIVGHDWGSPVAAHSALFYPERFTKLVLMSVPYTGRPEASPLGSLRAVFGDNFFYMLHHNEPGGIAEKEYDSDVRGILKRLYTSPDTPREDPEVTDPHKSAGGWLKRLGEPKEMPKWLLQEDLDYLVSQFEKAGFTGGVNYYRNLDTNWEITKDIEDLKIKAPTLFISGKDDMVIRGASAEELKISMKDHVEKLEGVVLFPGIGHWVQQEEPDKTNQALLEFLGN